MILFGINFALYFQLLKGKFTSFFKSEELKYYLLMILIAVVVITFNILGLNKGNIGLSIRESAFQVASVITTISNIGPGLELVGPTGNFAVFSPISKLVFSFCMLAGRLEIYPMIVLFSPSIWRKNH